MIAFFPELYGDELMYSWLARYYVRSGYISFAYVVEDLYVHSYTRPDVEFLKGELWNHSYYVETIGSVSEENIRRYIEHQSKSY